MDNSRYRLNFENPASRSLEILNMFNVCDVTLTLHSHHRIGTITEVSLRYIMWHTFALRMLFYASDLLARKMAEEIVTRL